MRVEIDSSTLNWLLTTAKQRTDQDIDAHLKLRGFAERYPQHATQPSPLSHEVLRLDAQAEFVLARAWHRRVRRSRRPQMANGK